MIEFKLPDMTCGHCASRVTQTLKGADPAAEVAIDLKAQTVRVQSTQPSTALAEALAGAGYPPA